jgi:phospholipid/cholesterol/gamma-HCH transport system substrate-binding protein
MFKLSAEAKVGLLVLGGSVILLYMTFAVGKYQFGERKGYTITAVFTSVAGLDEKAMVRMAGVKIGAVEKVELIDSRARVIMRIEPEVNIPRGAEAAVKTLGLMGERYVEIMPPKTPGHGSRSSSNDPSERSAHLQNGEQISVTVSPSDVDHLVAQLSAISDDIKQVTGSLRQVFGTERGTRSMEDILADLRGTMSNIKDFSHTLQNNGSELVMRMNELVASLNGVVSENRDNLKVSMENVREASKNAELTLASIESMTRKIERGEGTLGKLVTDDSMYKNIDTAAKGISDYTARIERMRTIVGFRSEYMFPNTKNYFTLEIKPTTDKAYIIEVNNDPFGKYTRTVTTTTPPGGDVVSETYEDKYKFSIMYVKRWGNLALRAGLIESTGGAGAEYFLFDDKVKFGVEAFNFNSKEPHNENTHVKATASYNINKLIFLNAGYDNILNADRKAAFVGIGIRFDDEDLKYLLGSVPTPK